MTNWLEIQAQLDTRDYKEFGRTLDGQMGYTGFFSPSYGINLVFHILDFPLFNVVNRYFDPYIGFGVCFASYYPSFPDTSIPGYGLRTFSSVQLRIANAVFFGLEFSYSRFYFYGKGEEVYQDDWSSPVYIKYYDDPEILNYSLSARLGFYLHFKRK